MDTTRRVAPGRRLCYVTGPNRTARQGSRAISDLTSRRIKDRIIGLFPDREIFVRSNGQVRFVRISTGLQLKVAGGLAALARLPKLTALNLYGNAGITDAGLEQLGRSAALRRLYVWQTGVTAAGVAKLKAARPDLAVQLDAGAGLAAVAAGASTGK